MGGIGMGGTGGISGIGRRCRSCYIVAEDAMDRMGIGNSAAAKGGMAKGNGLWIGNEGGAKEADRGCDDSGRRK